MVFSANIEDLKKSLSIASLSVLNSGEDIRTHAIFELSLDKSYFLISSSDKDKMSSSPLLITEFNGTEEESFNFTTDPKKVLSIVNESDQKQIKFEYENKSNTLKIFSSDNIKAFISLSSYSVEDFKNFFKDRNFFTKTAEIKDCDSQTLIQAIKFIKGFLPTGDKIPKYSNIYLNNGSMFGSNGSNQIGGFKNLEFDNIEDLTLRGEMVTPLIDFLTTIKDEKIKISMSDKVVCFSSIDKTYIFSFRKSTEIMPRFPINLNIPIIKNFKINKNSLSKKLKRLSLIDPDNLGIECFINEGNISIETINERKSIEILEATIELENNYSFVTRCKQLKNIISLFQSPDLQFFIDKTTYSVYEKGEIEKENRENIPYICVGLMTLSKKL